MPKGLAGYQLRRAQRMANMQTVRAGGEVILTHPRPQTVYLTRYNSGTGETEQQFVLGVTPATSEYIIADNAPVA